MKLLCDKDLKILQDEYASLLLTRMEKVEGDNELSVLEITHFIDDVEVFWRKNLKLVEHLIKRLTNNNDVYYLAAAMYLGINTNEHYHYKAIGDFQCIDDPILKFDVFVRQGLTHLGNEKIESFFKRSYLDTIDALENYKYDFIFIPTSLLSWGSNELMTKTVQENTSNIIKSIFVDEIDDLDAYLDKFDTIGEIESRIDKQILSLIRFTEEEQTDWSLEKKCNHYFESHGLESFAEKEKFTHQNRFLMPITGLLGQAVDSIYKALMMEMTPFIRQNTSFMYLMLILQSNGNDDIEELLKKAIICHVFYKSYDNDDLAEYSYELFKNQFNDLNLVQEIYDEKKNLYGSLNDLVTYVRRKYNLVFSTLNK